MIHKVKSKTITIHPENRGLFQLKLRTNLSLKLGIYLLRGYIFIKKDNQRSLNDN